MQCFAISVFLLLPRLLSATAAPTAEEALGEAALIAGDECSSFGRAGGGAAPCALSALQLHSNGQQLSGLVERSVADQPPPAAAGPQSGPGMSAATWSSPKAANIADPVAGPAAISALPQRVVKRLNSSMATSSQLKSEYPVLLCTDCPIGTGQCIYLTGAGGYDGAGMSLPNDAVSSVHVAPGWKITLYENGHFRGASVVIGGPSTTCLTDVGFNDKASSWNVERVAGSGSSSDDWRVQLLAMVNSVRARTGAPSLCLNAKLNGASQSQSDSGSYGHTWFYIKQQGYQWSRLGQNIARGQGSVQDVFNAWYNEVPPHDGHRLNILDAKFTQMGAGWATGSNMWTQNFASSSSETCS